MLYSYDITIPANTLENDPTVKMCKVTSGVVRKVSIGFPPGPRVLAHVRIFFQEHQIWPTNPDGDFSWDNFIYEFEEEFRVDVAPFDFKIMGWNEDDTNEHTITLALNILRGEYGLEQLLALRAPVVIAEG